MRFDRRFSGFAPKPPAARCPLERADRIVEVLAPESWTSARTEAWLDWAETLPSDTPGQTPASLLKAAGDDLLGGGPDRHARRLAAWGLALGFFEDEAAALAFGEELVGAMERGVIATGAQLAFGARVNPLAADPAAAPELEPPRVGTPAFEAAAAALRAGRGLAAGLPAGVAERLRAVTEAVRRCEGDADACASPSSNQTLARAALAARQAGFGDCAIGQAIRIGRAGQALSLCEGGDTARRALNAVAERSDLARGVAALA
ncbi:MAG: hypothetical protein ACREEQ_10705, partial [Caulobacteraceae bacterium]